MSSGASGSSQRSKTPSKRNAIADDTAELIAQIAVMSDKCDAQLEQFEAPRAIMAERIPTRDACAYLQTKTLKKKSLAKQRAAS